MQTKPLLYGLIGFFVGGLLVAIAATTFDKPEQTSTNNQSNVLTMDEMTADLKNKTGDEYDKAFISHMIEHHQAAVEMAKLSANNAKHAEIKQLSSAIISAQEKEINDMRQWQSMWNYTTTDGSHTSH